jgi:hypothetical protein
MKMAIIYFISHADYGMHLAFMVVGTFIYLHQHSVQGKNVVPMTAFLPDHHYLCRTATTDSPFRSHLYTCIMANGRNSKRTAANGATTAETKKKKAFGHVKRLVVLNRLSQVAILFAKDVTMNLCAISQQSI